VLELDENIYLSKPDVDLAESNLFKIFPKERITVNYDV